MRRITRVGVGAVLGALAIATTTGVGTGTALAEDACSPSFISGSSYLSRICGVQDYDQRRVAGTLQGDGRSITLAPSLLGDGSCHCVPTSFTDLLGYYVQNGVKGAFPPKFDWEGGRAGYVARPGVAAGSYLNGQPFTAAERAAYNQTTFTIGTLGAAVEVTDTKCGTSFDTVLNYFNLLRALYPQGNFVTSYLDPGKTAPKNIAAMMAAGATVEVAYGWFDGYVENSTSNVSWNSRPGGHVLALRSISGNSLTGEIGLADPATVADPAETPTEDKFRQGRFGTRTLPLTRIYNPGKNVYRWRVGDASNGSVRILDGILVVWPISVVMASGNQVKWFPGVEFNNRSTGAASPPPAPVQLKAKTFNLGATVLDAAILPATGEIAYLVKGDSMVRAVAIGSGEKRPLGKAPDGASQIEASPGGDQVFVGGKKELIQFDPRSDEPLLVKRIPVPGEIRSLAYDSSQGPLKGRLAAITSDRGLHQISPGSLAVTSTRKLAKSFLAGSGPLNTAVDAKGQLILRRGSASDLRVIGVRTGSPKRRTLGSLSGNGGLVLTERGSVLTIRGGKLLDLTPGGSELTKSPFAGRAGGGRLLAVTRGGTDLGSDRLGEIVDQRNDASPFPEMHR